MDSIPRYGEYGVPNYVEAGGRIELTEQAGPALLPGGLLQVEAVHRTVVSFSPGHPGRISFAADRTGAFTIELEEHHLHIGKLRVG